MTRNRPPRAGPPAPSSKAPYDFGPALPEAYGVTFVVAWPRDPECVFATWEGGDALRAKDLTDGSVLEVRVQRAGSWYFSARPEHEYEIELMAGGRAVAASRRVRTPRLGAATRVDGAWTPAPGQQDVLRDLLRRRLGGEGRLTS